jgi:hypothetical protein
MPTQAEAALTVPQITQRKTLEYNFCAESTRLYRRYNRPQLWRATGWVSGREADGRESIGETDLVPSAPVHAARLAALTAGHFRALAATYAEVFDAGVTLYRLDRANYDRLRRAHDGVGEVTV